MTQDVFRCWDLPDRTIPLARHSDRPGPSSRSAQRGLGASAAEPTLHTQPTDSAGPGASPATGETHFRLPRQRRWASRVRLAGLKAAHTTPTIDVLRAHPASSSPTV